MKIISFKLKSMKKLSIVFVVVFSFAFLSLACVLGDDGKLQEYFSQCSSFREIDRAYCYAGIAMEKKDYEICEYLHDVNTAAWVRDCYAEIAVEMEDEAVCDLIEDRFSAGQCKSMVRGTSRVWSIH